MSAELKHDHQGLRPTVSGLLFENLVPWAVLVDDLKGVWSEATLRNWRRRGLPTEKIRGKLYVDPVRVAEWIKRTTNT